MAIILQHLMTPPPLCLPLNSLSLSQASIAAGRQNSTQNGTSSTQSGSSQTTVSTLSSPQHSINCLSKADYSSKGVLQMIVIVHVYSSLRYYVCAIILPLFFLPQINLTTSPATAQLISRSQSVNSSSSAISQQAVLLGNASSSTLTATQAQMYLRAQMVN